MSNKKPTLKTAQPPDKKRQVFEYKGYVRCDLGREDKAAFLEWSETSESDVLFEWLLKMADSGYKVSFGESNAGMTATLSNVDGPEESRGWILSAMAGRAEKALQLLQYKHVMVLDGVWYVDGPDDGELLR